MKKVMKRVITACLAFAMILALVTPASVEAATKNESLTLYKGETYTWYLTGVKSLSSASSTKKAVATVKANKSKKQYTISAKKAGTSVVTIKGKDYYGHTQSLKIKVTVAEPKFDLKLQKLDGNYILISLKNNTKATFDRFMETKLMPAKKKAAIKSPYLIEYQSIISVFIRISAFSLRAVSH